MWFFALFLAWPLVEIALYVTLGAWLGLALTLIIVVGTAALGVVLIRWQGSHALIRLRSDLLAARNPVGQVAGSVLIVLAAVMLILPGFMTDVLGLILLIPQVRRAIIAALAERARMHAMDRAVGAMLHSKPHAPKGEVIDGEATEVPAEPHKPSGWTRH